jgi:hypothetical protein
LDSVPSIPLAHWESDWVRGVVDDCFGAGKFTAHEGEGGGEKSKSGKTEEGVHGQWGKRKTVHRVRSEQRLVTGPAMKSIPRGQSAKCQACDGRAITAFTPITASQMFVMLQTYIWTCTSVIRAAPTEVLPYNIHTVNHTACTAICTSLFPSLNALAHSGTIHEQLKQIYSTLAASVNYQSCDTCAVTPITTITAIQISTYFHLID